MINSNCVLFHLFQFTVIRSVHIVIINLVYIFVIINKLLLQSVFTTLAFFVIHLDPNCQSNNLTVTCITCLQVDQLYLHCIRKSRSFLTMAACKLLAHSLVTIHLDYCNAVFCGARNDVIRQLEHVQRRFARIVCRKYNNNHSSVTELMWGLHWLTI